jgi:septal ring factor EnvC (AmiA/AmiB activator)
MSDTTTPMPLRALCNITNTSVKNRQPASRQFVDILKSEINGIQTEIDQVSAQVAQAQKENQEISSKFRGVNFYNINFLIPE